MISSSSPKVPSLASKNSVKTSTSRLKKTSVEVEPSSPEEKQTQKKHVSIKKIESTREKMTGTTTKTSKRSTKSSGSVKQKKAVPLAKKKRSAATPKAKASSTRKKKAPRPIEFPKTTWGVDSVVGFEATEHLPPPELTSIAGGFVFQEDKVILANVPGRGWEIIGGRIDIGESPEETFRREAFNQIGVNLTQVKMIGVVKIEHYRTGTSKLSLSLSAWFRSAVYRNRG